MIEIIQNLNPENFRELMAGVSILITIMFIFLSIKKSIREHSLKTIGILVVLSVGLFANNVTTYFLAIIILATLVTNLDFLENISAIIRNSDSYFKFKESQKTVKEIEKTIEKENEAIEKSIVEEENTNINTTEQDSSINISVKKSNLTTIQFGMLAEEYTIKFLEGKYGQPVKRYIKISGNNKKAEFDGILSMKTKDVVLEIKIARNGFIPKSFIRDSIYKYVTYIKECIAYFKKPVELRYILVGDFPERYKKQITGLVNEIEDLGVELTIEILSFEEIGLDKILSMD